MTLSFLRLLTCLFLIHVQLFWASFDSLVKEWYTERTSTVVKVSGDTFAIQLSDDMPSQDSSKKHYNALSLYALRQLTHYIV